MQNVTVLTIQILQIIHDTKMKDTYDYVVVVGGAGCVMASGLSEDPAVRVHQVFFS